jgi:hypothetical protein
MQMTSPGLSVLRASIISLLTPVMHFPDGLKCGPHRPLFSSNNDLVPALIPHKEWRNGSVGDVGGVPLTKRRKCVYYTEWEVLTNKPNFR